MQFRKYEMTDAQWKTQRAKIQKDSFDGEKCWDMDVCASVIELGHLVITPAVYDEDGKVITEQVLSDKMAIDIIWQNDEVKGFAIYKVWPEPVGLHSFGYDIDLDYINAYNNR
jgi:hypothetical protein